MDSPDVCGTLSMLFSGVTTDPALIYVTGLRSGENLKPQNTPKMPPTKEAGLLTNLIIPQPKGDGGARALRSSPG